MGINLFYNKSERSKSTTGCFEIPSVDETDDFKLWNRVSVGINCLRDSKDEKLPALFLKEPKLDDSWPGFYCGENRWVKPNPFELKQKIDISDISWDNKHDVLNRELGKLGIFLYQKVQHQEHQEQ